ncbi:hypothetical protein BD779DRAFT_1674370 [Infundibulicybe gibba]|nr:hypothetical protein BD779DRAFT_1674370 [Infundibulicybe gibba]
MSTALIQDLHQVASLAESFAQQRPKSNKSSQFAESLDQEGRFLAPLAYFLSGSYDRAEAALEELSPSINASTDHGGYQFDALPNCFIRSAYKSLVDHMPLSEASITDVLQDLRTLGHQHALVTAVNQHFLGKYCGATARNENHARAMKTLDSAFTSVREAEFELSGVPTTACLTLIWQYGDRHSHTKKWKEAANWFLAGSHQLFRASNPGIGPKCFRKAALCYIEQREYARASTVIRQCPPDAATTHYIIFLTAVHQGLEDDAIKAIHGMVKAPDFDRKMLLLATQISHQSEMKHGEAVVEALTLIRCIIRLVLNLLLEPGANKIVLINTVVDHFRTAKILTDAACAQKAISLIIKTCHGYGGQPTTARFRAVRSGNNMGLHIGIEVRLRAIAAEIRSCKARTTNIMNKNIFGEGDIYRTEYFVHTLRVFEAELLAQLKDWDGLSQVIEDVVTSGSMAACTYEAVADILWIERDCPINGKMKLYFAVMFKFGRPPTTQVLYEALEAILRASLDHNTLSVEKFSRWLRAICTITLARNTPADRVKAIGYVEQAMTVMEGSNESEEPYPMDERQWLLGTSYNTGAECLHASMLDEAKRWFEASTVICKFIPGGKDRAEKHHESSQLLSDISIQLDANIPSVSNPVKLSFPAILALYTSFVFITLVSVNPRSSNNVKTQSELIAPGAVTVCAPLDRSPSSALLTR